MGQTNVNIRMDEDLKKQFDKFCNEIGLTMTSAVTIYAKTVVREQRIPFELGVFLPNAQTIQAIDEVNCGRNLSKRFSDIDQLMDDLNA